MSLQVLGSPCVFNSRPESPLALLAKLVHREQDEARAGGPEPRPQALSLSSLLCPWSNRLSKVLPAQSGEELEETAQGATGLKSKQTNRKHRRGFLGPHAMDGEELDFYNSRPGRDAFGRLHPARLTNGCYRRLVGFLFSLTLSICRRCTIFFVHLWLDL